MFPQIVNGFVLVNGAIVALFGFLGYHNTGSLPSLYAGVGSGALLMVGALGLFAKKRFGKFLSLAMTGMLIALFVYRYTVAGKLFLVFLAALNLISFLLLIFRDCETKKRTI